MSIAALPPTRWRPGRAAPAALSRAIAVLLAATATAAATPTITWLTTPAFGNETVLVQGAGLASIATVVVSFLSNSSAPPLRLSPLPLPDANDHSLAFRLPLDIPLDAYAVTLVDASGNTSAPWMLNAPTPWWVQGDQGDSASPGGWLRVSGLALSLQAPASNVAALWAQLRTQRDATAALLSQTDDALAVESPLAAAAAALLSTRAALASAVAAAPATTVRLTSASTGRVITLNATLNSSQYSATFLLPSDIPLDLYTVAVSNGYGGAHCNSDVSRSGTVVSLI